MQVPKTKFTHQKIGEKSSVFDGAGRAFDGGVHIKNKSNEIPCSLGDVRYLRESESSFLLNQTCKQKPTFAARNTPFHSRAMLCYSGAKPRGPVCRNTKPAEVAAPTYKRGFVMPIFLGLVRFHASPLMVTGGMGISVRTAARLLACYEHPVHLLPVVRSQVVRLNPAGTKTMTAIQQAKCAAAPTTGTTDPIQLHADAHNALSMAVFYLRQPDANVAGARRKAVQALSALRSLSLAMAG